MHYKKGTNIFAAHGEQIGVVEAVVMNPRSKKVSHLIVRKGWLFTEDKVLPIEWVEYEGVDNITLRADISNLDNLPDYEETHHVPVDVENYPEAYLAGYASPMYRYAPFGSWLSLSGIPDATDGTQIEKTEENIPENRVVVEPGAIVRSNEGEHIGEVSRVLVDPQTNIATHFVIGQGVLVRDHKLIPLDWVDSITRQEVRLLVGTKVLDRVPKYEDERV
jgi:uncharacterized protein YrrD